MIQEAVVVLIKQQLNIFKEAQTEVKYIFPL